MKKTTERHFVVGSCPWATRHDVQICRAFCSWLVVFCTVKLWLSRTLVCNKIVDHSDVVGASPVGAAPTTSSLATWHLTSMDWAKTIARRDEKDSIFGIWCVYITGLLVLRNRLCPCTCGPCNSSENGGWGLINPCNLWQTQYCLDKTKYNNVYILWNMYPIYVRNATRGRRPSVILRC